MTVFKPQKRTKTKEQLSESLSQQEKKETERKEQKEHKREMQTCRTCKIMDITIPRYIINSLTSEQ